MSKSIFSPRLFFSALAVAAPAACLFFASDAFAAAQGIFHAEPPKQEAYYFGEVLCNAFNEARPFGFIFRIIAYIAGVIAAMRGVHHLKLHSESPQSNKLNVGLMYLVGAGGLLSLPSFVGMLQSTLWTGQSLAGGGTALDCAQGTEVAANIEGLDAMLAAFVLNIKGPLISLASITAILAGVFMIVNGLIKASKYGTDSKTYSMHSILTNLGFGALLTTLGNMLPVLVTSLFGTDEITSSSALGYSGLSTLIGGEVSMRFKEAVTAALIFVQVIGAIAFVRGWLIMKKVVEGSGNASLAQGLTHIIGGVLAINIFQFLILMDHTFGTNLLE